MKMTSEHFNFIKSKFLEFGVTTINNHKQWLLSPENPRKPQDLEKRLRWDIYNKLNISANFYISLYTYLDDSHIDTALKRIMVEILNPIESKTEETVQSIYQTFVHEGFFDDGGTNRDNILSKLTCIITNVKIDMRDGKDCI